MSAILDARAVEVKIQAAYDKKIAAIYGLAQAQLGAMLENFHKVQPSGQGKQGRFWKNNTSEAANAVFGEVVKNKEAIGFFLAHGVKYGVYLELANNRQNEALRPLIELYGANYIMDVREIFGNG